MDSSEIPFFDVIIVGAGIMGSSAAANLSCNSKLKVLLVEQFNFLHKFGSSHGQSRIIRAAYPETEYTALAVESLNLWTKLEEETKEKCVRWTGGIDLGRNSNGELDQVQEVLKSHDIAYEVLNPEEIKKKFPIFDLPADYKGVYCARAGIVDATKAVSMYQIQARKNGATLIEKTKVKTIEYDWNQSQFNISAKCSEKEKDQMFYAKKIVLTTGAWTSDLLQQFKEEEDVQKQKELPYLNPIQTTIHFWKCLDQKTIANASETPIFIDYEDTHIYGFPINEKENYMKICYHYGPDCEPNNRTYDVDEKGKNVIIDFIRGKLTGIGTEETIHESCMYTMTKDEDFFIDIWPSNSNLIIGSGFSGHGFKMGPVIGKIISDLVEFGKTDYDISKFKLKR